MGLNTRLIDRAAQELSKTPLIALIGALQEKIRPSKCMSLYRCTGKICKIDGGGRMQILYTASWGVCGLVYIRK